MLRTCWANKLAGTGPWSLTQPPIAPDASLVDDAVFTKQGCLITGMMTLLTPRAQLETNPILPGLALAPAGLPVLRQVASHPHPHSSAPATNQGPCPHFQFSQLHTTHSELRLTTPAWPEAQGTRHTLPHRTRQTQNTQMMK